MTLAWLSSAGAHASVTMLGTRVIYPASASDQALRFSNPDDHPNLVQVWLDDGHTENAAPGPSPFMVIPPVFRVEPRGGQVVRLSYVGAALPQDRESLFFLNFLQVPALKADSVGENQLVLTVRSRMKLFYRPLGLDNEEEAARAPDALTFVIEPAGAGAGASIVARNASAYHVVLQQAALLSDGQPQELASATMIGPFEELRWPLAQTPADRTGLRLQLRIVNDVGVEIVRDYPLH
ncbi:putative pili assembly chaperone protein [Herbaspirillum rubrisubalbicans M1]|uniref:fimbrial biogenesis chaperone n=1 Tax=Herbaspirillum rubrisubalbicans TaxID=80842 RepID=UPI00073A0FAF|nr:molecular chaperone [Herbaspirillum rubrisubalbicans]ALU88652.1 putative pili assembly chaperone protein [Herbaspirillum rubrisubalbicans M1]